VPAASSRATTSRAVDLHGESGLLIDVFDKLGALIGTVEEMALDTSTK